MKKDDTRRDAPGADEATSTDGEAVVAVTALMEERRRYEGWISALEARRATTADHVFDRVHRDYTTRLDAVLVQLTTHGDDLRREMESLTSRLAGLTAEHQRAEDERAEAELRAHVGELSGEDWTRASAASDAALADLSTRRDGVEQELARTKELLDSTVRPPAARASVGVAAPVAVDPPEAPPAEPPAAPPAPPAKSTRASLALGAEALPTAEQDETPQPPIELPASVIAAEQRLLDIEERPARASVPVAQQPEPPAQPPPRKSQGFDELAFLSSVVDTPAGAFDPAPADEPDEKSRRDTFARRSQEDAIIHLSEGSTPLGSPVIEKEGNPPVASNEGSSAIRRDSSADGVKSLKCSECGAMNYPTEWYCERCGAELASL